MNKVKHTDRLAMVIVIMGLVAVILLIGFSEQLTNRLGSSSYSMEYEKELFRRKDSEQNKFFLHFFQYLGRFWPYIINSKFRLV